MVNKRVQRNEFELDFSSLLDSPAAEDSVSPDGKPQLPEGEKYLVFHLDEKLYAVNSGQVSEVIGSLPVAALPPVSAARAPWLAGVVNLRGKTIAVVDLRKLWKKQTSLPKRTKLLVLRSSKGLGAANRIVGAPMVAAFIVDKLSEMISLTPKEIEFSAADFESSFPTFFGRATRDSQTIYLLDAENLFSSLIVNI